MADEIRAGEWYVHWGVSGVEVLDLEGRPVATIHGKDEAEVFRRALLVAAAPGLRDWVRASLEVFSLFAAKEEGRVAESAADMVEGLRVVLSHAGVDPDDGPGGEQDSEAPTSGGPTT